MSQSKDAAPDAAARPAADGRSDRERRLEQLLAERGRLLGKLRELEREVAELRREAAAATAAPEAGSEIAFSIRGADAQRGDFEPPPAVAVEDLRACLAKVVLALRRGGARMESVELLITFDPHGGEIRSICSRQVGDQAWQTQLHRHGPEGPAAGET
jgi:hypothetical protein